ACHGERLARGLEPRQLADRLAQRRRVAECRRGLGDALPRAREVRVDRRRAPEISDGFVRMTREARDRAPLNEHARMRRAIERELEESPASGFVATDVARHAERRQALRGFLAV